ncbi:MAG: type II toxin-antitoxin system VapC family toxin [Actinobacteria bacterium]|nr:type II toxin-antitoxin system VapC family toxin [Actinomycetota bacterium]
MGASEARALAVVDASVFGALAFNESRSGEAAGLLAGVTPVAPGLVRYEMANIARTKALRDPSSSGLVTRAFRRWLELPVKLVSPEFDGVLSLALAEDLSAYDAAYVYVASALDAPLLTFDMRLASAWRRLG